MECQFSASWEAAPTEGTEAVASDISVVICFASLIVLPSFLVMKDPMEVCPLSREGVPSIRPITGRPLLFPSSFTHISISASCEVLTLSGDIWAYHVLQIGRAHV